MAIRALTCRELDAFLAAYLDGELSAEQRAAFERHLSACPACRSYLEGYREAVRLGSLAGRADAELEVPAELAAAIRALRST